MVADCDESEKRGFSRGCLGRFSKRFDHRKMLLLLAFLVLTIPSASIMVSSTFGSAGHRDLPARIQSGSAPVFWATPPNPTTGAWNTTFVFYFYIGDDDNDNLNLTWDWGDGSPLELNYTDPAASIIEAMNTHVYAPAIIPGAPEEIFFLNLSADDGNGNNVTSTITVVVQLPGNTGPVAPSAILPSGKVDPNDNVTIYVNSSDPEGDPLTWTYIFNNTFVDFAPIVNMTNRSDPGAVVWSNITVRFADFSGVGNYTIDLFVTDAPPPYDVFPHNFSRRVGPIQVAVNQKPSATNVITVNPDSPIINSTLGYVEVRFSIDASDPDGDPLNATWDFGDGSPFAHNESLGGRGTVTFVQVWNYTNGGTYTISFTVTDGIPGHEVVVSQPLNVSSTNRPPSVIRFNFTYAKLDYAQPNETVNFTLKIFDPEKDTIFLTVDFGDNSTRLYMNLSDYSDFNVTVLFNHTFVEVGNYTVKIWYTDNKIGVFNHSKEYNVSVKVKIPVIIPPVVWSWWDYTSLGLLCMIPVVILFQFVYMSRKRKAIENEGMSLEEWKLRKSAGLDQELERELKKERDEGL